MILGSLKRWLRLSTPFLDRLLRYLLESGNLWGHHALALLGCGGDHLVWWHLVSVFCVPWGVIILGEMNGLRVRTVSTSLGEWISSGNEWSQSPCHPVSGSTCPRLAIGAWCGRPCFCVVFAFLAWPCTGSPKVPSDVADGYRSPFWLCASHNGNPVLVHRQRGTKVFFPSSLQDRKLLAIPGIHYFDAHRLRAHLL